jgi:myosin-5
VGEERGEARGAARRGAPRGPPGKATPPRLDPRRALPSPPAAPQLLAGADAQERARWRLGRDATAHRLTSAAGCVALPGVDDGELFRVTRHAMRAVGISAADQEQVFSLLAALLHLSDLSFTTCPRDGDEACAVAGGGEASLAAAAGLLGVDAAALLKAVTTRTRATPDGPIVSPLAARAASDTRDALSKVIYARLFDWLVARINAAIGEDLVGRPLPLAG